MKNKFYNTKLETNVRKQKYLKECKISREKYIKELEQKENLSFLENHKAFEDERNYENVKRLYCEQAKQFKQYASECLDDYNEYLVAYDMADRNYFDIENALCRKKITISQVEKIYKIALDFIDGFENMFRINLLNV